MAVEELLLPVFVLRLYIFYSFSYTKVNAVSSGKKRI